MNAFISSIQSRSVREEDVGRFNELDDRLDNLEAHIAYHAHWQAAADEYAAWYRGRAHLAEKAEHIMRAIAEGADADLINEMRASLVHELGSVEAVESGLSCHCETHRCTVTMAIATDIDDSTFRAAFISAVETYFSGSATGRDLRLKVDLSYLAPRTLYPEGVPDKGSQIDLIEHMDRFPKGFFVLTTGAASTHAFIGRSILLGSRPTTLRVLAHEAGHLLGFKDIYLRHAVRSDRPENGHVFVEFSGLQPNLMGDSYGGTVSQKMRDVILRQNCSFD